MPSTEGTLAAYIKRPYVPSDVPSLQTTLPSEYVVPTQTKMTLSLLEHGESRKEPRRPKRTLSSRLRKLERSVKRLQKGFKEIDHNRKRMRKVSKELDRSTRQLKEWSQNSHALHEVVIRTAVLPRVAAVVYNAMFETGMGLRPTYNDSQQHLLETDDSDAADLGMIQMETFANTVSPACPRLLRCHVPDSEVVA